ncbi:hypothetical protein [Nitrosomonas supralitoralis]|uniref:hypothetical protein n=1 Tax=Nitrosomonas supralitoralis TaxID=2116706 RepID=UPI0011C47019|nr:hypothetical protein [Nitrosomonas supralitoralis]
MEYASRQWAPNLTGLDRFFFTFHRWHANLRILEIDEIKTLPTFHFLEMLIGTLRCEYLDQAEMMCWAKANINEYRWKSHCRDLLHTPMAA